MERLSNTHFSWYWLAVCGLFLLTLGYSSYKLTESPPTWFDEGIYVQVAQSIANTGTQAIQTAPGVFAPTGHVTGGYPFLVPVALSLKIFGNSLWADRVPMVAFILLCAGFAYLLILKLFGKTEALLTLLLLATFPLLYGNGKNVLGEVPGMFYALLALYFIWRVEHTRFKEIGPYVWAGLFTGLAVATKPVFFLLPVAVGLVFLFSIRSRSWNWRGIAFGALTFAAPLALWVYLQFGGDSFSSVLFHYANPYAESSLAHTTLQNVTRFFKEATPLYCAALMALWAFAVGIKIYRKENIFLAEIIAFLFSILILLAYLRTEGWYRYFFEAMVLALIFAPHSLRVIAREVEHFWPRARLVALVPLPLILLGAVQFYQLNFSSWVAEHYESTQTAALEKYFSSFTLTDVLIYNTPEIVPFLKDADYYQYFDIEPTGSLAYGKENLQLLEKGAPPGVIVTAADYGKHKDLFKRYKQSESVGSYLVLIRQ